MKKSGSCPKCSSTEIYGPAIRNFEEGISVEDKFASFLHTKSLRSDAYICVNCGYVEEYLNA